MKNYAIYLPEALVKKAEKKGFKKEEECFDGKTFSTSPTAEEICGWLREEKFTNVVVNSRSIVHSPTNGDRFDNYYYEIQCPNHKLFSVQGTEEYSKYELAIIAGLKKALDLI